MRGYDYHTGIVFAAYANGSERSIAKGGRYDHIGEVFGRKRGATGFTVRIANLLNVVAVPQESDNKVIVDENADSSDVSLWLRIQQLRDEGYIVTESGTDTGADLVLTDIDGDWQLRARD